MNDLSNFNSEINRNLCNLRGTQAIEGIELSSATLRNVMRMVENKTNYRVIVNEIVNKYSQMV